MIMKVPRLSGVCSNRLTVVPSTDRSGGVLEDTGLNELESAVGGQVLRPGGQDYEMARRVFNAMIDRRPAAIVRCAGVDDVIAAVNCARSHDVPLSVKSG